MDIASIRRQRVVFRRAELVLTLHTKTTTRSGVKVCTSFSSRDIDIVVVLGIIDGEFSGGNPYDGT